MNKYIYIVLATVIIGMTITISVLDGRLTACREEIALKDAINAIEAMENQRIIAQMVIAKSMQEKKAKDIQNKYDKLRNQETDNLSCPELMDNINDILLDLNK